MQLKRKLRMTGVRLFSIDSDLRHNAFVLLKGIILMQRCTKRTTATKANRSLPIAVKEWTVLKHCSRLSPMQAGVCFTCCGSSLQQVYPPFSLLLCQVQPLLGDFMCSYLQNHRGGTAWSLTVSNILKT